MSIPILEFDADIEEFHRKIERSISDIVRLRKAAERLNDMETGGRRGHGKPSLREQFGSAALNTALYGGIAASLSFLKSGLENAAEEARGFARLGMAMDLRGIGKTMQESVKAKIKDIQFGTGVDDSELSTMLAKVFAAGEGNVTEAFNKLQFALDMQARGYADADTVLKALTKAGADTERQLKQLAASMGIQAKDGMELNDVIQLMHDQVSGSAEAVHKAAGGYAALNVSLENAGKSVGEGMQAAYGGAMEWFAEWIHKITGNKNATEMRGDSKDRYDSAKKRINEQRQHAVEYFEGERKKVMEAVGNRTMSRDLAQQKLNELEKRAAEADARYDAKRATADATYRQQVGIIDANTTAGPTGAAPHVAGTVGKDDKKPKGRISDPETYRREQADKLRIHVSAPSGSRVSATNSMGAGY